jgi:O-antigen/teichoic acid export membrane protein
MDPSAISEEAAVSSGSEHARRFLFSVLWSWLGVATNLFTGIFLAPYIIRELGAERYGIWALAFALIEYFWVFDLGLRSAVVNFVSRFRTRDEPENVNQVVNTALAYFLGISVVVVALTLGGAGQAHRLFMISEARRPEFARLVLLIGFSWAAGLVFCVFQAGLEAFQQFKIYNHIWIATLMVRSFGCAALLYFGYGVIALGAMVVVSQGLGYLLNFLAFRSVFPELRFSAALVRKARMREMLVYGRDSFLATSSNMFLNQGPAIMVAHFLPAAFVGYYSIPSRLLQYAVDALARIGFVTAPNTAELVTRGRMDHVLNLGMYLNRYCFALFMPFCLFLMVYGRELIQVWVPAFASYSAPLLVPFALSTAIATAGQFNSSSILWGMAKHRVYAFSLIAEGILLLAGMILAIPAYGLLGAAWVAAGLMIVNRGLILPWILCHYLKFPWHKYVQSIYLKPMVIAALVYALMYGIKTEGLSGRNWPELLLAAGLTGVIYLLVAFFTCLEPEHRTLLGQWFSSRVPTAGERHP